MAMQHSTTQHPKDPIRLERARESLAQDKVRNGMRKLRKALCDPVRLEIIRALTAGPLCVNDLSIAIKRAPAATSQHLRVLRDLDLVDRERRGTTIYYRLSPTQAGRLQSVFNSLSEVDDEKSA